VITTPLAIADDVADIWRPLSSAEAARAASLCTKASILLRSEVPSVDDRIDLYATAPTDPAALPAEVVANVVAGMVKRVMVNSDGVRSKSESAGPFARSMTFVESTAAAPATMGELEVTESDLAKLTPRTPRNQMSSIRISAGLAPAALAIDPFQTVPELRGTRLY
jgi:hypothetical protein